MSAEFDHFKALLIDQRAELLEANRQSGESRQAVELDQQSVGRVSRIDAMQRQEMAKAGEQRRLSEISRIDAALLRIAGDRFGDCLKCGEEIAPKRLELDPSAPLCIGCATS